MKTQKKHSLFQLIVFGILIFVLNSCSDIYQGNRVNYNFASKKITKTEFPKHDSGKMVENDSVKNTRPLIMAENSEIQIEMRNFNPLKYQIIIGDTAYDRFETNIENFDQYIKLPTTGSEAITSSGDGGDDDKKNKSGSASPKLCEPLEDQLKALETLTKDINTKIADYNLYITKISNIVNVYDYLKTLDVINDKIVISSVEKNVIQPLVCEHPQNKSLDNSIDKVFSNQLVDIELVYYKEVEQIKDGLTQAFAATNNIKPSDCGSVISEDVYSKIYQEFVKKYYEQLKVIEDFESNRKSKILPNFTKTMLVYDKLKSLSENDPSFVTKSYSINKDLRTIKIYKFNPETETKKLHDEINIQLSRGFRIGVSGGLFVSGLYDEKYTLHSKDSIYTSQHIQNGSVADTLVSDKFTAIYSTTNAKVSFGGMIFLQAHSQNASVLNYGGYLGIGALFNDQTRWTGSCGLSLIIGRNHRFMINAGPIIAQVDRLAKPYKIDTYYKETIDNVPISKVWEVNWMVGFSWKISN